jgi:hypothetical protein
MIKMLLPILTFTAGDVSTTLFRAWPVLRPKSGILLHFWGVCGYRDLFTRHFLGIANTSGLSQSFEESEGRLAHCGAC